MLKWTAPWRINLLGPGHQILGCLDHDTKFCPFKWVLLLKGAICCFSFCFCTREKCCCVQIPNKEFCTSLLNCGFIGFYWTLYKIPRISLKWGSWRIHSVISCLSVCHVISWANCAGWFNNYRGLLTYWPPLQSRWLQLLNFANYCSSFPTHPPGLSRTTLPTHCHQTGPPLPACSFHS